MTSTETSPHAARYPAGALAFPHRDLIGIGQLERHEILFLLDEAEQWVALNRQALIDRARADERAAAEAYNATVVARFGLAGSHGVAGHAGALRHLLE